MDPRPQASCSHASLTEPPATGSSPTQDSGSRGRPLGTSKLGSRPGLKPLNKAQAIQKLWRACSFLGLRVAVGTVSCLAELYFSGRASRMLFRWISRSPEKECFGEVRSFSLSLFLSCLPHTNKDTLVFPLQDQILFLSPTLSPVK